ncbi:granule-bound starch synthase 2 chloroplastic amyloplastic-like, partial [Trifolium medium]|nr:granule-bound starch synthase 2 chloroplastic amyloplastic-like [Trifolium medium]
GSNTQESSSTSASSNAVENQNGGNVLRNNAYSREKETRDVDINQGFDERKKRNDAERSSSWLHFNEQPKNTRYEGKKTIRPDTVPKDLASSIKTSSLKFENLQRESESSSKEVANEPDNVESDGENPPPLAGTNVMNIILVAAECAPWSKTGN